MHAEKLAEKMGVTPEKAKSYAFWLTDYLMDNLTEAAIDCGAYHNSPLNGDKNMIESFKAILWAMFEEIEGGKPEAAGPWVGISYDGISINKERPK